MYAKHSILTYLTSLPHSVVFHLQLFLILAPKMRYSKDFVGSFKVAKINMIPLQLPILLFIF